MVRGYHLIFCAYGFWLPNDPRGSWSDFVWAWDLRRFGEATTTATRRSVAGARHDHGLRRTAKVTMKYPPVIFTDAMIHTIAAGFADYAQRSHVPVHACSILPEHVHMVVGRHRLPCEKLAQQFRIAATAALNRAGIHPLDGYTDHRGRTPKPWAEGEWKVFINDADHLARAIDYVKRNPPKEGRPIQHWPFITPVYCSPDG